MQTFRDNFPRAKAFVSAAERTSVRQVLEETGPIDLLLASPECRNHSCARGDRPRIEGSRETALQVLRFARVMRPRWIILENVIHMRPWSRYAELLEKLESLGYCVAEQILDAADFGVPQRRRRLFLICDREGPAPTQLNRSKGRKRTAVTILDRRGTWQTNPLKTPRRATATIERAKRAIRALGRETSFLLVYYGSDGAGGWQSLDVPLRTITTLDRFGLVEPSEAGHTLRMLQVPELMRAMGFGKEFKLLHGSRRDKIHLLGNAVCPPVIAAILSTLRSHTSAETFATGRMPRKEEWNLGCSAALP